MDYVQREAIMQNLQKLPNRIAQEEEYLIECTKTIQEDQR